MLSTGKASLFLSKHKRFLEGDLVGSCLQKSMPNLLGIFVSQIPNYRPDLIDDDQLKNSARVYLAPIKRGELKELFES